MHLHHYELFDKTMHAGAFERLELERDLRGALGYRYFRLVLQLQMKIEACQIECMP